MKISQSQSIDERIKKLFDEIESSELYAVVSAKSDISVMIYARMQECGVSCAELARRLGKSRAYISKMLGGGTNMTIETLVRIARVLDCDFSAFVPRSKDDMRRAIATIDRCKQQKSGEIAPQDFPHYAGRPVLRMLPDTRFKTQQKIARISHATTPCDEQALMRA